MLHSSTNKFKSKFCQWAQTSLPPESLKKFNYSLNQVISQHLVDCDDRVQIMIRNLVDTENFNINIKIHFNENFIVNNRVQFELFPYIKDYAKSKKEVKSEVVCCCVGEVKKTEKGIDVRPDRYSAFSLDNKKLYAILHEVSNLFK